jgi:hypothetical protein
MWSGVTSRLWTSRFVTIASAAALAFAVSLPAGVADAAGFTVISQSDAVSVTGRSYGEWSALWWQTSLSQTPSSNGLSSNSCAVASGGVVFLFGSATGAPINITCDVPAGAVLFFPLVNTFDLSVPCPPYATICDSLDTPQKLRENLLSFAIFPANTLFATIDSSPVSPAPDPKVLPGSGYRACAGGYPGCALASTGFTVVLPADNLFGLPIAGPHLTVADGYWLMLQAPSSAGTHTLHFGGTQTSPGTSRILPGRGRVSSKASKDGAGMNTQDVTYQLILS